MTTTVQLCPQIRNLVDPRATVDDRLAGLMEHAVGCDDCRAALEAQDPVVAMMALVELAGGRPQPSSIDDRDASTLEARAVEDVLLPQLQGTSAGPPVERFVARNGADALYAALEAVSLLFVRASEDSLRLHPEWPLKFERQRRALVHGSEALLDNRKIAREIARFTQLWEGDTPQLEVVALTDSLGEILYRVRGMLAHFRALPLTTDESLLVYIPYNQRIANLALRWGEGSTSRFARVVPGTKAVRGWGTLATLIEQIDPDIEIIVEVFNAPDTLHAPRFVNNRIVDVNYAQPFVTEVVFPVRF